MASAARGGGDGMALILSLFRRILRVHRAQLPGPVRGLGDSYARHEFSSHLKAKTTRPQWEAFVREWQDYVGKLSGHADTGVSHPGLRSGDMEPGTLDSMSVEQRKKMSELQEEMRNLGKPE